MSVVHSVQEGMHKQTQTQNDHRFSNAKRFDNLAKNKFGYDDLLPPPKIPASAFIDVSSPDAWIPQQQLQDDQLGEQQDQQEQSNESECKYKTEMCKNWEEKGICPYGNKCQFAHGRDELREVMRHPKYKTDVCRSYHINGSCDYGSRCRFVHKKTEMRVRQGQDAAYVFEQQITQLRMSVLHMNPEREYAQSSDRSGWFSEIDAYVRNVQLGNNVPLPAWAQDTTSGGDTFRSSSDDGDNSSFRKQNLSFSSDGDKAITDDWENWGESNATDVAAALFSKSEEEEEEKEDIKVVVPNPKKKYRLPFFQKLHIRKKRS